MGRSTYVQTCLGERLVRQPHRGITVDRPLVAIPVGVSERVVRLKGASREDRALRSGPRDVVESMSIGAENCSSPRRVVPTCTQRSRSSSWGRRDRASLLKGN